MSAEYLTCNLIALPAAAEYLASILIVLKLLLNCLKRFSSNLFFASGKVSLSALSFTLFHNDPAALQDHWGRCRIRTRDLCPAPPPHPQKSVTELHTSSLIASKAASEFLSKSMTALQAAAESPTLQLDCLKSCF